LGTDFDLRDNAYKPYACGLVVHPTIDGCSRIRALHRPDPAAIAAVRLRVAPLVLDLCNKSELTRALESKYSIYHAAAIGLVRGRGGVKEFTDEAVRDPALARVRALTTAVADLSITEDQVHIEVVMQNGQRFELFVAESLGNVHRPLSNAQLEEKFRDLAVLALPAERVDDLVERCLSVDTLDDAGDLCRATIPATPVARPARSSEPSS
jgi:2-methylcitrate dehydratase PrpD